MPPRALEYTQNPISVESVEDTYDDIGDKEDDYTDECCDKGIYIGIPIYDTHYDVNLLASRVSTKSFFDYDIDEVMNYLRDNNIMEIPPRRREVPFSPDIMQVHIDDSQVFTVVLKTHWLRLVQRKWKNVIGCRQNIMRHPNYIRNREIHGKGTIELPSLQGMLSNL